jgi:hypothetical protein
VKRHLINTLVVAAALAFVAWLIAQSYSSSQRAEQEAELQVQGGPEFRGSRVSGDNPTPPEAQAKRMRVLNPPASGYGAKKMP